MRSERVRDREARAEVFGKEVHLLDVIEKNLVDGVLGLLVLLESVLLGLLALLALRIDVGWDQRFVYL